MLSTGWTSTTRQVQLASVRTRRALDASRRQNHVREHLAAFPRCAGVGLALIDIVSAAATPPRACWPPLLLPPAVPLVCPVSLRRPSPT
ncbi:hypothetical protein L226DRAFT_185599 [Lentinus tigrinus ALCF2SS1-7]|uniref:uncharacterized protein n=1 Tax=Lentinus tigrinus ALCF2SS1-7 TaxID=1328758 RepID=UPI001165F245|nr:hypothetical protein L226DRAFT_185599 [Lentinus tigrinus ALCF2SS1-7]